MIRSCFVALIAFAAFFCGPPQPKIAALFELRSWAMAEALARTAAVDTVTLTNRSGSAQRDYPLQLGRPFIHGAIANFPQVLIDGAPAPTQADVKNRYPDGSVKFAVIAVVVPSLPSGKPVTITFANQPSGNNAPLTQAQMLGQGFDARMSLTAPGGNAQGVSARDMLEHGAYKLWTSGQVAQTAEIADDSAAAAYDIGFDGTHHPFRPRFYATFWPQTRQVMVRFVGEAGKSTEQTDLAYKLALAIGADGKTVYAEDLTGGGAKKKKHWAQTSWTKVFWLGGAPEPKIDIDYNLAYLASTRFIPNFDTSLAIGERPVAGWDARWNGKAHDIYDGSWNGGLWTGAMSSAGGRPELGPYPSWTLAWLYSGDWRLRRLALGMADLAAAFPANLRESAAGKRLLRTDPAGSSTGLGHAVSIADRRTIAGYTADQLYNYSYTAAADKLTVVGPIDAHPPFSIDGAHQPSPFYVPYLVTGDPWYLNEMYMWAARSALMYNGAATPYNYGRGPTGAEGGISDETRGCGWVLRNRAETAFIAPDADPEKAYFTYLTNDALARWEGNMNITGTAYQGNAMWNWGRTTGNHQAAGLGDISPLHFWDLASDIIGSPASSNPFTPDVVQAGSPWMQNYFTYGLARAAELGFAAGPLFSWNAAFNIGETLDSGLPILNASYRLPAFSAVTKDWYQTWPAVVAAIKPGYANGTPDNTYYKGGLPQYYKDQGYSESYVAVAHGIAALAYGEPRGNQNWAWLKANDPGITNDGDLSPDPSWALAPRTDANLLPAIPP